MPNIYLNHGQVTEVDIEDYLELSKYKWYAKYDESTKSYYAFGIINKKLTSMARFIKKAPKHLLVDHFDRNTLNNRRNNLRLCTHSQNSQNSKLRKDNTTGYRGVYAVKNKNSITYRAAIQVEGKVIKLGTRKTAREAALLYNKAALQYFGMYAARNITK